MINICILSYKRAGRVKTFHSLPRSLKDSIFLYVRAEEFDDYKKHYDELCTIKPLYNVNNVGETREAILNDQRGNRILVLDDDIELCIPKVDPKWGFLRKDYIASEAEVYKLLKDIEGWMDKGYAHGQLRGLTQPREARLVYPHQISSYAPSGTIFLDTGKIPKEATYLGWPICEDDAFYLQLINLGYNSVNIATVCALPRFNAKGGCTTYRTEDFVQMTYDRLAETFPNNVTRFYRRNPHTGVSRKTKVIRVSPRTIERNKVLQSERGYVVE